MGTIVTFYSFKGGVGRSMALANVGVLLAQWGYSVLVVDFDLEAPGLESFFQSFIDIQTTKKSRGLVDFLCPYFEKRTKVAAWKADSISIPLPRTSGGFALWTAGMRDDEYFQRVRHLDFPELYSNMDGGALIEGLRTELKSAIGAGSASRAAILKEISEAAVAVLLVSPDYLASEYILDAELPTLLRAAEERGLRITWIAERPSSFEDTEIGRFQAANDPSAPLSELDASQRDRALVEISKRISEIAGRAY